MQHPWFYKKIGKISDTLLNSFKEIAEIQPYITSPVFSCGAIQTNNILFTDEFIACRNLLLEELDIYFDSKKHVSTNFARLLPMSYVKEHNDMNSTKTPHNQDILIKLQIPIITNTHSGMMWAPEHHITEVVNFKEGEIYIIDNIRLHSVVNLSNVYRYNITSRYTYDAVRDQSLLD